MSSNAPANVKTNNALLFEDQFTKGLDEKKKDLFTLKLSAHEELSKYVYSELTKKDKTKLLDEDKVIIDENDPTLQNQLGYDDLLLTNAVTQNREQDKIDKQRYVKEVKYYVNVNSLLVQRQHLEQTYPDPAHFIFTMHRSYTNVKSVRVIQSEIPNTETMITGGNNRIDFTLKNVGAGTTQSYTYYIPLGDYTTTQLATQMQDDMNDLAAAFAGPDAFTITIDLNINKTTISVRQAPPPALEFTIEFFDFSTLMVSDAIDPDIDLYKMLGFEDNNYPNFMTSLTNYIPSNFGSYDVPARPVAIRLAKYVMLSIRGLDNVFDELTLIPFLSLFTFNDVEQNQMAINTFSKTVSIFDPPLRELSVLDITWINEFGLVYNFNGTNYAFILEIVELQDRLMSSNMDVRRGVVDRSSYV